MIMHKPVVNVLHVKESVENLPYIFMTSENTDSIEVAMSEILRRT